MIRSLSLVLVALASASGCAGTEVCMGTPNDTAEVVEMREMSAKPYDWLGRTVRLDAAADIQPSGCTTQECGCCRQCFAQVRLRQGKLRLPVSNVDCSHDLCGGACLLHSWDEALSDLDGVAHDDPVTAWGVLREVANPTAPLGVGFVFDVEGLCVVPSS